MAVESLDVVADGDADGVTPALLLVVALDSWLLGIMGGPRDAGFGVNLTIVATDGASFELFRELVVTVAVTVAVAVVVDDDEDAAGGDCGVDVVGFICDVVIPLPLFSPRPVAPTGAVPVVVAVEEDKGIACGALLGFCDLRTPCSGLTPLQMSTISFPDKLSYSSNPAAIYTESSKTNNNNNNNNTRQYYVIT